MSPNPLQTEITPLATQGRSFLQHRSLPLKGTAVAAPPTLHSLLLSQTSTSSTAAEAKKNVDKPKRKAKQVSDASDVAAEALRITRESLQKEELAQLRPNGGKFPRNGIAARQNTLFYVVGRWFLRISDS